MKNLSLILLGMLLITVSCRKTTPRIIFSDEKISKVFWQDFDPSGYIYHTTTYQVEYKSNDVDSMTVIDTMVVAGDTTVTVGTKKFTYYQGYYMINYSGQLSNNEVVFPTKVEISSSGLVTSVTCDDPHYAATFNLISAEYFYNGNELIGSHNLYSYPPASGGSLLTTADTFTYIWDNSGNNIQFSHTNYLFPTTQSFDLSHQGQTGDINAIQQFLVYGRAYILSANVTVKVDNSDFNYEYDDQGRITRLYFIESNGYPAEYRYEYQ